MKTFLQVLVLLSVVTGFTFPCYSQNQMADSLRLELKKHSAADSARCYLMLRLTEELKYIDPKASLSMGLQAYALANSINNPALIVKACFVLGILYSDGVHADSGRLYLHQGVKITREIHDTLWEAKTLSQLGVLELTAGNYEESLAIFQNAIPLTEASGSTTLLGTVYSNIATIFFQLDEYEKSLEYDLKGYYLIKQKENVKVIFTLANIGQSYGAIGNYDSAVYFMKLSLKKAIFYNDSVQMAYALGCLGDQYREQGQPDSALVFYNYALSIYNYISYDGPDVGIVMGGLADALLRKKDYKSALQYYLESESLLQEDNYQDQLEYTLKGISNAYAGLGDYQNAWNYAQKYTMLHDTMNAISKTEATNQLERKFSLTQKQKEIESLNKEQLLQKKAVAQQKLLKNIFIGTAVLLLLLAFLLYNRYQIKQRTSKQLEVQNEIIQEEKKRAETAQYRAEKSEAFKSEFLANMSHEIRTPMNAISGFTNLLFDVEGEDKRLQYLNAIKKSSDNLLVVINDVLDLSKLEAGKMQLEKSPFRIREVLNFIYETFQLKAAEKNLQWKTEIAPDVPSLVMGDVSRLTQVLMNLVGNAMKFTEKGRVELVVSNFHLAIDHLQTANCKLHFKITDTGAGIAKDQIERIFESFTQATNDQRKYGGTGLGLTITRNLVTLMNGTIEVQSEAGKGAVFICSIPFEIASEEQWQQYHKKELIYEEDLGEELRGISIMVAEDNEYNQLLIADTLKKFIPEVKIEMVNNGKELLIKLPNANCQLILMDVQMPEMDGYEASRIIRNEMQNTIPIIALTASVIRSDLDKCLQAGMNRYVPKPFSAKELLIAIAELLGKNLNGISVAEKEIVLTGNNSIEASRYQWINLDHLNQLVSGDTIQFSRYLKLFQELIPVRMSVLKEALQREDYPTVRKTVHVMKPQMASVGLLKAKKLAESIESNYHREERIAGDVEELMKECSAALEEVRQELGVIL
ncbi:MAG: ATP-binding protein [Chitinophagales bacterium]